MHVAPWLPTPELEPPLVLKPRFGSRGEDVIRCDDEDAIGRTLAELATRPWFEATGAVDFTSAYSFGDDVFAAATSALVAVEAAA